MSDAALDDLLNAGFRYAMSLTHDPVEAEDVLHDALASVLRKHGPLERAYLFTSIRNRYIDLYRREKRLTFVALEGDREENESPRELPSTDRWEMPDFIGEATLREAMATLRVEEREAMYLNVVEGYTVQEISEMTDRPRGTILSLLHRTRAKLRRKLGESEVGHG